MKLIPFLPIFLSCLLAICSTAVSSPGDLEMEDIHQKKISPLQSIKNNPVILIFISTDCPIANGYAPEINRIYEKYSPKMVKFTLVQIDPELRDEEAKKHAKDYGLKPPIVIDRKHQLVHASGAKVTPEAVVLDPSGKVLYRGRINDRYAGYGDRRNTIQNHNLRDAIDAVLAGKKVESKEVPALGCLIETLP